MINIKLTNKEHEILKNLMTQWDFEKKYKVKWKNFYYKELEKLLYKIHNTKKEIKK